MVDDLPLFEMANLGVAQTGVQGVIYISTSDGSHWARVKYSEKPGRNQPSFSVSIGPNPEVKASSVDRRVLSRMAPVVIAWVQLNHEALLRFWTDGVNWMDEDVTAFKAALKKV